MKWPPSPATLLGYIAVVATLAAIVGGGAALKASNANEDRIDEINANSARLCDAVKALQDSQARNTRARLRQNAQFTKSPQVAAAFGLTVEQLQALSEKSAATDRQLIVDTKHAVDLACG